MFSFVFTFFRRIGKNKAKKRTGIQEAIRKANLQFKNVMEAKLKIRGPLKAPMPKNICSNPKPNPFCSPEISINRLLRPPSRIPNPAPIKATNKKIVDSFLENTKPIKPAAISEAPMRRKGFLPKKSDATPAIKTEAK